MFAKRLIWYYSAILAIIIVGQGGIVYTAP